MSSVSPETALGASPIRERHVLVLDLSKSMFAPLPDPDTPGSDKQKIEVARTAVYRILENAEATGAMFGLVTFTENVRVAVPLTEIRRENLPYIESLISVLTPSGRSAIWDAMAVGADLLRTGGQGVQGNLVLVTDGWDNASRRFEVKPPNQGSAGNRMDLIPYLLPGGSALTLRIIGIGSGKERDKGIDGARMNQVVQELSGRARSMGIPAAFSYQEVVTGAQLFEQMVHAFLDVDYEGGGPIDQLHPEEMAQRAASAARALKEPQQHATVSRLADRPSAETPDGTEYSEATELEVDVLAQTAGAPPAYLRERYGPLGGVIESYLAKEYSTALERLQRAEPYLPPVTRMYWGARIRFDRGEIVDAARLLLQAWNETEALPVASRGRILRRLALLQARMQNDRETETLVRVIDETESRLRRVDPELRARITELFGRLLELRGTYQLTRESSEVDPAEAARQHELAVDEVFGMLQDLRLDNTSGEPAVDGALDFVELCLAEMR